MTRAIVRIEKAIVFVLVMAAMLTLALAASAGKPGAEMAPSAFSSSPAAS